MPDSEKNITLVRATAVLPLHQYLFYVKAIFQSPFMTMISIGPKHKLTPDLFIGKNF